MAQVLRQSTERVVRIGPFMDVADAATPETGITLGAADQAEVLKAAGAATVDISGATWAAITGADGWYNLTLTTSHTDTVGDLTVVVQDASVCLPVFARFTVVEESVFDDVYAGSAAFGSLVDAVWDEALTGATHNVVNSSGRRLRGLQDFGVYQDAAVWVDTVNGTAGTTDFENGTVTNPVDSIADAKTIADSIGLKRFRIRAGSSITLAATFDGYEFVGIGWNLALGSQDIAASYFYGAVITGVGTATISDALDYPNFELCGIGTATVPPCRMKECTLGATLTLGSAGTYLLSSCRSNVAGGGAPVIDMGAAVGATELNVRAYSGGIDLRNCLTGDTVTLEYIAGQAILASSCTGGTIVLRGVGSLTDSSAGATVNSTAFVSNTSTNAEVDTALVGIGLDHLLAASVTGTDITDNSIIARLASKSATADWDSFNNTTDSLEAVADASGSSVLTEEVENSLTVKQVLRLMLSGLAGKSSGAGSGQIAFRDTADTVDRIVAQTDSVGNRNAVTLDPDDA